MTSSEPEERALGGASSGPSRRAREDDAVLCGRVAPGGRLPDQTSGRLRRALFLDRDGIVNVDHGHVHRRDHFQFVEGIFKLTREAAARGYLLVVVTNQAGIARGRYSESDFGDLTAWMFDRFRDRGVHIDGVYYCPHHPTEGAHPYRRVCPCRKPEPGMILRARDELAIALDRSALIGDKSSDVEAGYRAGVRHLCLVGGRTPTPSLPLSTTVRRALIDARQWLVSLDGSPPGRP